MIRFALFAITLVVLAGCAKDVKFDSTEPLLEICQAWGDTMIGYSRQDTELTREGIQRQHAVYNHLCKKIVDNFN